MHSALYSSEEDDTSSIPPDPGPLSKKPSGLHLMLPDFQETETGVYHECVCDCVRVYVTETCVMLGQGLRVPHL